jgi:MFS transporter, DHA1 family, tetracycline resistance protein
MNREFRRVHLKVFVLFAAFLIQFSYGVINPIMPILVGRYDGGALEIGWLYSALWFAQFLTVPGLGALSDRYGRRPILLLCLMGGSLGFLILSLGNALWVMFAGLIIFGLFDGVPGTVFASVADITQPAARTRSFAIVNAAIALGFIFGPITGGRLVQQSAVTPLSLVFILLIVALVWGYVALSETRSEKLSSASFSLSSLNPFAQLFTIFQFSKLRWLLLSYVILVMMPFALVPNLPILSRDLFSWTPAQVAPLFAIFGVVNLLSQLILLPWLLQRSRETHLAMIGSFLAALAFLVFALVPISRIASLLYVAVFLFALGQPLAVTAIGGLTSRFVSTNVQGSVQGGLQALQALGGIVAPLWISFLYSRFNASTPYWLGMGLLLLSGLFTMFAMPQLRDVSDQEKSA